MTSLSYKAEKLTAHNYTTWTTIIKSQLKSKDLWTIIVNDENTTDEEKLKNEEAKHIMYIAMEPQEIAATGVCVSAHDLWMKIKENHEGAEANLQSVSLAEFLSLKYRKGESLVAFAGRFETGLGKLESTDFKVDEKIKLWVFANSLPEHMMNTVQMFTIANKNGKVSELISELKARFLMETNETGRKSVAYNSHENTFRENKVNWNRPSADQSNFQQRNKQMACNYCKKQGHGWKECRKLKSDNERKKRFGEQNKKITHGSSGAFSANAHKFSEGKYTWIVDSGATSHMTPYGDGLVNFKRFDEPHTIFLGDGRGLEALGHGDLPFNSNEYNGTLISVLYVPEMKENLFSVGRAVEQGCEVRFSKESHLVSFYRNGRLVLEGSQQPSGRCFLLNLKPSASSQGEHALMGTTIEQWHKRLGHCSVQTVRDMLKNRVVDGLVITNLNQHECRPCILGKICRAHHPSRDKIRATKMSAILHIDTVGPMRIPSLGGARYFTLATEEYSGYMQAKFVPMKTNITDAVKALINETELISSRTVKCIATDNGTEYTNYELERFLNHRGIMHTYSANYTPQQNGRAERANRTILEGARTLLIDSGLPEELWAEAVRTVTYTLNRVIGSHNKEKTRYELLCNAKPNISNLKIFGQKAIIRTSNPYHNGKMGEKGEEVTFVGYTDRHNTYRFYTDEPTPQVFESCDARFLTGDDKTDRRNEEEEMISLKLNELSTNNTGINESQLITDVENDEIESVNSDKTEAYVTSVEHEQSSAEEENTMVPNATIERRITRSISRLQSTEHETSDSDSASRTTDVAMFSLDDEPRTIRDAEQCENWINWKQAMIDELTALEKNKTWVLVDKPPHVKPIKNKWVYKLKLKPDGEIDKFKARLVAKGYTQIENVDYKETYAPVASMNTVRLFLAIANQNLMHIVQFDVKTAFLYGDLEEQLYMEQPIGFETGNKVCKLMKSLYGLKQAPRQWNRKFDHFLKLFDLQQASIDKCLYYNRDQTLLLAIYVDDGLAAGLDKQLLDNLIEHLKSNFELTVMDCETFLGLKITRDDKNRTLSIDQSHYVERVLNKFKMADAKPVSTPEQVGFKFTDSPLLTDEYPFKELVGSLLYLSTCSRPDISHAISVASQTANPTHAHWQALKRILRYLKGTKSLGIRFRWENRVELLGFSDADYANDEESRKSTTGFCNLYGKAPIVWRSQRQPIVTLSTTEAEYVAGCALVKELIPVREQLAELNKLDRNHPTTVYIDNMSTVRIANNENRQNRTKHIDIRHKWLTEQAQQNKIVVKHIGGDEQVADILTKPLYKTKFLTNRSKLLTYITMVLSIMVASSVVECLPRNLQQTDPITLVPSDYIYIAGDNRYKLRNVFLNPCEIFFKYTSSIRVTETLIRNCLDYYESKLLKSLSNCDRLPTIGPELTDVAATYACAEDTDTTEINQSSTSIGKCDIKRRRVEDHPVPELELAQINEKWNQHKKLINSLTMLERPKRFIPILMGILGFTVLAGTQVKTVKTVRNQTNQIEAINDIINAHSKILKDSIELYEFQRDSVVALHSWASSIDARIGDLDPKSMHSQMNRGKIANLVRTYMQWFEGQEKLLNDINSEAAQRKISPSLMKMINVSDTFEAAANQSTLFECTYRLENKSLTLDLDFLLPVADKDMEILSVLHMDHYQITKTSDGDDQFCWNHYKGPERVLRNKTANCIAALQESRIYKGAVRSQICNEPGLNEIYDSSYNERNWIEESCTKEPPHDQNRIQIYGIQGVHKIYCHPFEISIGNKTQRCPNHPIILEGHATFTIGNITHHGEFIDTTVSRRTRETNERKKRYAIPANLTETTKISDKPTKVDINATMNHFTSKMNATILRIKETIRNLPASVNFTKEHLSSILEHPLDSLSDGLEQFINYIQSVGSWMGVLGCAMAILMLMPALEVIFIGLKMAKFPVNLWLQSAKRVSTRLKEYESIPLMPTIGRRKRRWDDGVKRT